MGIVVWKKFTLVALIIFFCIIFVNRQPFLHSNLAWYDCFVAHYRTCVFVLCSWYIVVRLTLHITILLMWHWAVLMPSWFSGVVREWMGRSMGIKIFIHGNGNGNWPVVMGGNGNTDCVPAHL